MPAFNNRYRETVVMGIPVVGLLLFVMVLFLTIISIFLLSQGRLMQGIPPIALALAAATYTSLYVWLGERRWFFSYLIMDRVLRTALLGDELGT